MIVRGVLGLVWVALLVPSPAWCAEVLGRFGDWTVLRMTEQPAPQCSVSTRSADGLLRLDIEPIDNGGLAIFAAVANGPKEKPAADARVGISWMKTGGQMRLVTYPLAGSQLMAGPPVRLFVHTFLRKPEEVTALLSEAAGSAAVLVSLDPGYDEPLPTAGFSGAWAALKACDKARTMALPN